jgi:hypothetical protein
MRTNFFAAARTAVCLDVLLLLTLGVAAGQMHPVSIPKSNNRQRGVDANDKASDWHAPVGSSTVTIMGGVTTEFVPSEKVNQLDYNSRVGF